MNSAEAEKQQPDRYASFCKKALARARIKHARQELELAEAQKCSWYRQIGDSLLAHPGLCKRGDVQCCIENVHTHSRETVALNPKFDALQNAQLLYKKAKRGERGLEIAEEKVERTAGEISALEKLLEQCIALGQGELGGEEGEKRIQPLRAELERLGLLPGESRGEAPRGKGPEESVPYRRYIFDGWNVYIGKNDGQNDELSTRFARPADIWMHVAAHSGSHVVIRREKNAPWPPQEVLRKAASLAAWFSKAKHASYAEVHAAEARFVHKRRKSPPGEVIVERFRTIKTAPVSPQVYFPGEFARTDEL